MGLFTKTNNQTTHTEWHTVPVLKEDWQGVTEILIDEFEKKTFEMNVVKEKIDSVEETVIEISFPATLEEYGGVLYEMGVKGIGAVKA